MNLDTHRQQLFKRGSVVGTVQMHWICAPVSTIQPRSLQKCLQKSQVERGQLPGQWAYHLLGRKASHLLRNLMRMSQITLKKTRLVTMVIHSSKLQRQSSHSSHEDTTPKGKSTSKSLLPSGKLAGFQHLPLLLGLPVLPLSSLAVLPLPSLPLPVLPLPSLSVVEKVL